MNIRVVLALAVVATLAGCALPIYRGEPQYEWDVPSVFDVLGFEAREWGDNGLRSATVLVHADASPANWSSRLFARETVHFEIRMGNESWNSTSRRMIEWEPAEGADQWHGNIDLRSLVPGPRPRTLEPSSIDISLIRVIEDSERMPTTSFQLLGNASQDLGRVAAVADIADAHQDCRESNGYALCSVRANVTVTASGAGPVYLGDTSFTIDGAPVDAFRSIPHPILGSVAQPVLLYAARLEEGPHRVGMVLTTLDGSPLATAAAEFTVGPNP